VQLKASGEGLAAHSPGDGEDGSEVVDEVDRRGHAGPSDRERLRALRGTPVDTDSS